MIQYLTAEEAHLCIDGGRQFYLDAKLPGQFIPEAFCASWRNLISTGRGAIIGLFDGPDIAGALGCIAAPELNNYDTIAVEAFWFMIPGRRGSGLRLLMEFERWAKVKGCQRAAMIHLEALNPRLAEIYVRLGYKLIERHYLKTL